MHGRQKGKGSGKRYRSVVFLRRTRPDGKAPRKPEEPEQTPRSTGRTARKKHKIFRVETSRYGVETQRIHRSGTRQARRREKARRGNRSLDYQDFNSDAEETAVLVADNRLAELSETSEDDLRKILSELDGIVDLELTGFSETEVELLLRDIGSEEVLEEDVPEVSENPLTNFGDVFEFGGHRLMCGDYTDPEQVKKLMDGSVADMVFTDPPYNVDYDGNGRKIENDNLGNDFPEFLEKVIKNVFEFSDGAIYICMSSSEIGTLQSVFRRLGGHWSTFVIWAKDTFTLGRSDYHRQYEPILYGWREGGPHHFCGDRSQGDVWEFPKPKKNDVHPTMKPVELYERAVLNSSKPDGIVLDLFGGSGSTLVACSRTKRRCRMMEFEPKYCDVILKRYLALYPDITILKNGIKLLL